MVVPFFISKVSLENFPKYYHHSEFLYQVESFIVTIDQLPVLAVFVMNELQLQLFVDVVIVNVLFQLEFALMRKVNGFVVSSPQMGFVLV